MLSKSHDGVFVALQTIGQRAALLATTAALTLAAPALAQPAPVATAAAAADDSFGEIVVTAEKRSQSLQKVPLSITAIGTEKLDQLQVRSFDDYAKYLPSVSFTTLGPGSAAVYFRGVASGENNNHSGPLPSVGIYLDEQPITTIGGALDIHVYDIARVEALAGPQGTLYGASSQAGTIRIITNKPDVGKFAAGYDLELNKTFRGGVGGVAEGFVNVPLSDKAALRLVGWYDREGGYIDNLPGTRTYPTSGITINNKAVAKNNYNTVDTVGGRAALRFEASDALTITPTIMGQSQKSKGVFAQDKAFAGELAVVHFYPESFKDDWVQASLTIEGKISDFDLVYTGSYLERKVESQSDYTDYSFFYDAYYSTYIRNNAGQLINPSQHIDGNDKFSKLSQEFRISSPADKRLRLIAGLFYQRQTRDIQQEYFIDGLATSLSVTGHPNTWWLTKQYRIDRDYAAFGQVAFDIVEGLTLTGGGRFYKYDNSLIGFYGFGKGNPLGPAFGYGELFCFGPATTNNAPCTNLGVLTAGKVHPKQSKGDGFTHKLNLAWQATPDVLLYGTWSRGFRPGGINRNGQLDPYKPDFLTNYELGFKTSFANRRVRFNGAIFQEEWKAVQLAFLGQVGLTEIQNTGNARIKGFEFDLNVTPSDGLTLSASGTYTDAYLTTNYCKISTPTSAADCSAPAGNKVRAPKGQELPITPKFKGNIIARYEFPVMGVDAHVQGAASYVGSRYAALRTDDRATLGKLPAYTVADFTAGFKTGGGTTVELYLSNAFDSRGNLTRYTECATGTCGPEVYDVVVRPREVGLKFGQRF